MEQDFSLLIFGKPLVNVSLGDVQHYFQSPKTESDKLEFKSFPSDSSGAGIVKEMERRKPTKKRASTQMERFRLKFAYCWE
jgi:hypothetical protein